MPSFSNRSLPPRLADLEHEIKGYAREMGLDFYEVIFELLTYDEVNMVAAYGGYPNRYPHWRHGMQYEQLSKGYEYGLSKIYEMVINNDPTYAYLLESNPEVDQKLVMAHVYGHGDFFKNNFAFAHTNRKMMDEMANHATRVRRWIDRIGIEKVEDFIDRCLSLENLIDYHAPYIKRGAPQLPAGESEQESIRGLKSDREYMNKFINPPEYLAALHQRAEEEKGRSRRFPERPERDILAFLLENAPLEPWEQEILAIIREEAYYFAPQGMTKIMNEGWACLGSNTLVFTERGLLTMEELVAGGEANEVFDGETAQRVYDRNIIRDHETIRVVTRRGLDITGSNNHRVLLADRVTWKRLDELRAGDKLAVSGGDNLWPEEEVATNWSLPHRISLAEVAQQAGVSVDTVLRHREGAPVRKRDSVAAALAAYDSPANQKLSSQLARRVAVRIPQLVDESLAAFLGYLIGDGHISRVKHNLGLTTGDEPQAAAFSQLASELFGLSTIIKQDEGRLRVLLHSETVADFLIEGLGLTAGPSAREKRVPPVILRSPRHVVAAFLRAYFDCDAYAGKQGVILSTVSDRLAEQVQLLLLNFGILSRRRRQTDGCWHVHIAGTSALLFADRIGFGLERKNAALGEYIGAHQWTKHEKWEDEVVSLEPGRADVYDISVTETHRYAAGGLINHNSYWHSTIMTTRALKDSEVIDYADHHAGTVSMRPGSLNPYKIGIELYRDIEERWNKGRFGKDWDDCDDMAERQRWDRQLGLGRQKIFEVRKHYNDVTFIDEFLTPEFCLEHKLFVYGYNDKHQAWEILSRDFKLIKEKLLHQLTNFGQPVIEVVDANWDNRAELMLVHKHDGVDLKIDDARYTLMNVQSLWRRPVNLYTRVDGKSVILRFDGNEHTDRKAEL